ncbi:Hypothetical protein R9X50_00755300 [Acrodontium crateriforme]|uniref:HD domain-containing protein n=1 Tax=Acrodontium crateriforme TaxID=150365 RepID=A0AAQ3MBD2_9PEZI|nr:Hypothetical protein R9X50_00755300 [Acrodontium crateriforme]
MGATPRQTAAAIVDMLVTQGQGDYIGEAISQLEHSLQAAHQATLAQADDETVIAALLHDIGHFLPPKDVRAIAHDIRTMRTADANSSDEDEADNVGRVGHEMIGAQYLASLSFSPKVSALVGSHVAAKRYLCAVDPAYHATLSDASKKSLIFQGGPMSDEEVRQWSANDWCQDMCRLRKWDDAAKIVGLQVKPAEQYEAMIEKHLASRIQV